jgi:hypothetical protein
MTVHKCNNIYEIICPYKSVNGYRIAVACRGTKAENGPGRARAWKLKVGQGPGLEVDGPEGFGLLLHSIQ